MAPRPELPPQLLAGPFTRSTALAAGLTERQLRSRCWRRVFREVYVHAALDLTDEVRWQALQLAAPAHAVATDLTAAWLFGVWTPPPGGTVPLHMGIPRGRGTHSQLGATCRRIVVDEGDLDSWNGVGVTCPERTCFGLMARSSPTEAVVWADVFLHADLITLRGMIRYADEHPRRPHVCKIRGAMELARAAAASPMETRLRLVIVNGGLPEPPLINVPLYAEDGSFLGAPDMAYRPPLFGIEYDGDYHRDPHQHLADNVRENRLLVANVPLLRYGAADVYQRPERIVAEVGAMLRRAG